MHYPIELNLRFILLGIGALFILAILVDGLRRKHIRTRHTRLDEGSSPRLLDDEDSIDVVTDDHIDDYLLQDEPDDALLTDDELIVDESSLSEMGADSGVVPRAPIPIPSMEKPPKVSMQKILVVFALAEDGRPFSGYELLQALLSAGFRYGDMNIFHRYEALNGKGRILYSLASAEEPGIFDIQKMGGVSLKGLCFILQLTNEPSVDFKADLDSMLQTAHGIVEDLGGRLLDDNRKPFSKESYNYYLGVIAHHKQALIPESELEYEA